MITPGNILDVNTSSVTISNAAAVAAGTVVGGPYNIQGVRTLAIHCTASGGTGATISAFQVQISNDGTTWVVVPVQEVDYANSGLQSSITGSNTIWYVAVSGFAQARIVCSVQTINASNLIVQFLKDSPNSLLLNVTPYASPANGTQWLTSIVQTTTPAVKYQIKNSPGNLSHFVMSSATNNGFYVKLFDARVASVTVGTTAANMSYWCPPNATVSVNCGYTGIKFNAGITAVLSGAIGLDAVSAGTALPTSPAATVNFSFS